MATPPKAFSSLTIPVTAPAPKTAPQKASSRLSVSTWRTSCARPAPNAHRTAYSCWRCSPRTSSKPATLPHATNKMRITAPDNGSSNRSPSRFNSAVNGCALTVMPLKSGSVCACLAAIAVNSACACLRVTPSRNRPITFQFRSLDSSAKPAGRQ